MPSEVGDAVSVISEGPREVSGLGFCYGVSACDSAMPCVPARCMLLCARWPYFRSFTCLKATRVFPWAQLFFGVYFSLVPWICKKGVVVWITKPEYKPAGKKTSGLLQTWVALVALYNTLSRASQELLAVVLELFIQHPPGGIAPEDQICASALSPLLQFSGSIGTDKEYFLAARSQHLQLPVWCITEVADNTGKLWVCPLSLVFFSVPPTSKQADRPDLLKDIWVCWKQTTLWWDWLPEWAGGIFSNLWSAMNLKTASYFWVTSAFFRMWHSCHIFSLQLQT